MPCVLTSAPVSSCERLSHTRRNHLASKFSCTPQLLIQNSTASKLRKSFTPRHPCLTVRLPLCACAKQGQHNVQGEKSDLVHSEIIYFMFQLNLDMQLQRALNLDDFETAQDIRTEREQIDEAVAKHLAAKGLGCGSRSANQTAVAALASEGLRLRSELQRAVDEERYADAAQIRDRLKAVQEETAAAESQAASTSGPERKYKLGQRVKHAELAYDGVVCGWDNSCCEDDKWQQGSGAAQLQHGQQQPFYHLLVDSKDWEGSWAQPPIAYVAQELLTAPEPPDTWPEVHGYDSFDHAYLYNLFLGQDAQGNMLPIRQLRDKYSQQREDVYPKDEDSGNDADQPPLSDPD